VLDKLPNPANVPQPQWNRYRKLLRQYRKALSAYDFKGANPPEERVWLEHDLRTAKHNLDDFVSTLLGTKK
jgi:hypothetical protein